MAVIPECVAESETSQYLRDQGLELFYQGKVRDTFEVPDRPDWLLQVATDRLSIFDFVLPVLVPRKGEVLTALTRFWMMRVKDMMGNHLVPSERWPWRNAAVDLKLAGLDSLPLERCLVVRKVDIWPYEMVFRHHLGGSVYVEYQRTGKVAGWQLRSGLSKWDYLPHPRGPIFTPATKALAGHDANITVEDFKKEMGRKGARVVTKLRRLYHWAYGFARQRRICILDTKFEVGTSTNAPKSRKAPPVLLADELFTPDSSRFAYEADWNYAMKQNRDPVFFDKQVVRDWGVTVETPWGIGLNHLDTENSEHLAFVAQVEVPQGKIELTEERYLKVFQLLTGMTLDAYQHSYLLFETKQAS